MREEIVHALADRLAEYDVVVEVGIGRRPELARELAQSGAVVTATDIVSREVPDGVRFVRDDITDPTITVYRGADAIVARNLPPELHRPAARVTQRVDADLCFTTLGGDSPTVPVRRETLPGETLFLFPAERDIPQRP